MGQQHTRPLNIPEPVLSGNGVASIARNAGYLLGSQSIVRLFRSVYAIVLARYLGPELYGLFNYGLSWYLAFLPLTGFGLAVILIREVGRNRSQGTQVVAATSTIRILLTIVVAAACGVTGWFSEGVPEARKLILIFSIGLIGRSIAMWTEQLFTAYEINKYSFLQQTIFRPLEVVLGSVFLLYGGSLIAVAMIHVISWWGQALSGLVLARQRLVAVKMDFTWHKLKHVLSQGIPIGIGVVMVSWLQEGPVVLFRHTLGFGDSLGQLALAMQAFLILCAAPMAVSAASLPVLSRAAARNDGKDRMFAEVMLKGSFILGSAAGLAGIGLGPWFVDMIFGARYAEAGRLLGLSMWLLIPWGCGSAIWRMYLARGRFFLPTVCAGTGALVLSASIRWFVGNLDTTGAVIAAGAGMGVWSIGLIIMLATSGELNVSRAILRPGAAVLLAIAVFFALDGVQALLSLCASWLVLFGGTFCFGVLAPEERSALLKFVHIST